MNHIKSCIFIIIIFVGISCISCNRTSKRNKSKIISNPEKIDQQTSNNIKETLEYALQNQGKIDDTISLKLSEIVNRFYISTDFDNVWSKKEKWQPIADSVLNFIQNASLSGLYPNEYHFQDLKSLKFKLDTIK